MSKVFDKFLARAVTVATVAGLAMGLASAASATALTFSFDTGGAAASFNPLSSAETGVDFYNFGANGSNVPFTLTNDRIHVYLHEDTNTGNYSLGVILDARGGGHSGNGTLDFGGLPGTTSVLLLDDPGESGTHTTTPPTATHYFSWIDSYNDGIVLGNFTGPFDITLDLSGFGSSEISSWALYSDDGNGNANPLISDLGDTGDTLTIHAGYADDSQSVPEPATLVLLGAGLVGLGLTRRRKAPTA